MNNERQRATIIIRPEDALPDSPSIVENREDGSTVIYYPVKLTPIYDPNAGGGGYGRITGWEKRPLQDFR
jgi:hypothetical protein